MANLPENPQWADGIYQIETIDRVLGGPGGTANRQAKELADRTAFIAGPSGASKVGFTQAGAGAVARAMLDKAREVVSVKDFGAVGDGVADDTAAIQAAIDSLSTKKGVVFIPAGVYIVSSSINMRPAVALVGAGAEATIIKAKANTVVDGIVRAFYASPGNDYIYVEKLTIDGNRENGATGRGVLFKEVHVPSYLQDVTVLSCAADNIEITNSSVVQLVRVWSNRPSGGYALDVDTVRSLHIIGGAYEHVYGATAHVRIRNTGNYYYPQVFVHGAHIEGLMEAGIAAVEVGGGAQYYSVLGVEISGLQVIGKRSGGASSNYSIRALDANLALSVRGVSQTGVTSFGDGFSAGTPLPPAAAMSIIAWEYNGNLTSGYSLFSGLLATQNKEQIRTVRDYISSAISAFTVTETTVAIPAQPDTSYFVQISPQNFMGNNIVAYVDEASKTTTSFKIKFANITTGAAAQLSNATKFSVTVKRVV